MTQKAARSCPALLGLESSLVSTDPGKLLSLGKSLLRYFQLMVRTTPANSTQHQDTTLQYKNTFSKTPGHNVSVEHFSKTPGHNVSVEEHFSKTPGQNVSIGEHFSKTPGQNVSVEEHFSKTLSIFTLANLRLYFGSVIY
jgi:hypothetical protein